MSAPVQEECGFFGLGTTVAEAELRATLSLVAISERTNWFDAAGHAIDEQADTQVGHLVRYWLAGMDDIWPSDLTTAQANAIDPSLDYGVIPSADAGVGTWLDHVRPQLLAGAPGGGSPTMLQDRVDSALRGARLSHLGSTAGAWSAVFVAYCMRGTAIGLGLEEDSGGSHTGHNALLDADIAHRVYVEEAYDRRLGLDPKTGTYHAFRPSERSVRVGDIIVVDRQASTIANVVPFDDIPTAFASGYGLHGDIVLEVTPSYAETIGGNLGYQETIDGDPCDLSETATTFSVRRRRYPLSDSGDGTLQVDRQWLFVQEDGDGVLPVSSVNCPEPDLHDRSTGRVFTLLGPVERCVTLPGNV